MPFGMKNDPATFQRMVNKLVRDIDGCEGYIDDVVIYSDNWSDHIRQIKRFFQIMREAKLTINLMKSEFSKATVKYLGHIVGQGQVRPLDAKIQTIVKYPIKVYTDHNPLTFLKTMKNKNQRLVRWNLALQEYNLEIQHIPGSENVVADALSRCIG